MSVKKGKKKERRIVQSGVAHVQASFNNTIVTITDMSGNTVVWASAGNQGFKGSRKSTPFAAQRAGEAAARKAMESGMRQVDVYGMDQARVENQRSVHFKERVCAGSI